MLENALTLQKVTDTAALLASHDRAPELDNLAKMIIHEIPEK